MQRRFAWVLTFLFGLAGGGALATGWYTATASYDASYAGGARSGTAGSVLIVGDDARQVPPPSGHWTLSETGALTWMTHDSTLPSGSRDLDERSQAERQKAIDEQERDTYCQINGCDP